jgi:glycosyltransferase involved in cell wall biosynthesis
MIAPAVRQLLARYPDVTVVLAGPDFPPWAVAVRSSQQIELHPGWVPLPGYYRWLASLALDVFITPLVDIPYNAVKPCLKPLEAAGLGIPVIASAVGAYAEDLAHEDTALLVENTTAAWLTALTRVVDDAELRAHLSAGGRAWAATRTIEQTGPLWADLWEAA